MTEEGMSNALDAIHEEAVALLSMGLSADARARVDTIIALARYELDVRSADEIKKHQKP